MNKLSAGLGLVGLHVASSTSIVFTEMPASIPGNFTTYQYDLDTKDLKTVATGEEGSYTAWDFVSGAAVCGDTYYAALDDSIIDWGLAAISLSTGKVRTWASKDLPTTNLLHNVWCNPSGSDDSILAVQSVTTGDAVFGLYSMTISGEDVTQTQIGAFPHDKNNLFAGFDTEFQATPDRSQVWANFATSNYDSGHLHVMDSSNGDIKSYLYPISGGYPYSAVPLSNDPSEFLVARNENGVQKGQGSFSNDNIRVTDSVEAPELFTGSQPWTVEASSNQIYAITTHSGKDQEQSLDVIDAKTGDIISSTKFKEILSRSYHSVGGLALL